MKINSLETESVDQSGRIIATSKTIFKSKPSVGVRDNVFKVLAGNIKEHRSFSKGSMLVTVRTSQGVFKRMYDEKS